MFSHNIKTNDWIYFLHLLLSLFFYSNYFLFNQPIISSTDVLNINFPLLIFAKHNFTSGELGLWNPYLLSGVSSFATSNAPVFAPDNWLQFLFPDKYFFLAGTYFSFIKMWLIGIFSYLIFKEELNSRKWGFFSSVVYQLSGFTIWATMVYDVLSMHLLTTLSLYLVWTIYKRSLHWTYVLLTLALLMNMLSSNIAYTSYSMLIISICFLYRFIILIRTNKVQFRHFITVFLAFLTSVILHLFRLIPVWMETHNSNRGFSFGTDFRDTSFLGMRLFNPEIFGICYRSSFKPISSLGSQFQGMHIQWAMPQFFGVLAALLVTWAIISPQKGRINFWTIYTIIALSLIIFIEPFETIFKLINPVYHTLSMQIFLPIGFCMLAGYSARNLEREGVNFSINSKLFSFWIFILISIVFYNIAIEASAVKDKIKLLRILLGIVGGGALLAWFIYIKYKRTAVFFTILAFIFLLIGLLYYLFFAFYSNPTYLSHLKNLSATLISLIIIYALVCTIQIKNIPIKFMAFAGGLIIIFILFAGIIPWTNEVRHIPTFTQDRFLSALGFTRFFLIALIFTTLLYSLSEKKIETKWLYPVLLSILLVEQLPSNKIHSHLVVNPFYKYSTPYPPIQNQQVTDPSIKDLDLINYRVNLPNTVLNIPLYQELYGSSNEILSSIYSIYKIRSYGGHYNVVSNRYGAFLKGIIPNMPQGELGYGLYTRLKNDRFLDLSGVRYNYDPIQKKVDVRQNALSRLMLFNKFEVIPDQNQSLERLRSKDFNPMKSIVLNKPPKIPLHENSSESAKKIKKFSSTSDWLEANIHTPTPGILFFGDSFHDGWKAWVNGKEQPIQTGNFNFMALAIPPGENKVVFKFIPKSFKLGLNIGFAGIAIFLITVSILFFRRNSLNKAYYQSLKIDS